jgi:hypothetical protein
MVNIIQICISAVKSMQEPQEDHVEETRAEKKYVPLLCELL